MATMGQRIKELRLSLGMTQGALADALRISKSAVGMYETDKREPDNKTLDCIADFFNVDMDYLYGKSDIKNKYEWWKVRDGHDEQDQIPDLPAASNIIPMPTMRKIPLVGNIACGEPILAEENIECEVDIPDNIRADFALRCKGRSMEGANIFDGDIVYIRKQDMVDNGQIAAVLIEDMEAEATLKRVYYNPEEGELRLVPENPKEWTKVFRGEELNSIRILGLAVGLTRSLEDK